MLTVLQTTPPGSKLPFKPNFSPKSIIDALKKAPPPMISTDMDKVIPEGKTVLCNQHEVVMGEKSSDQYEYLGTTDLIACIFVYIHNDTQFVALHVDNNKTPLNLKRYIEKFTSKENIKIALIGGTPNRPEESHQNLLHIIEAILSLSSSIDIEINAQYLIEANAFKPTGKPAVIRDTLLEKASALYQMRYQEPLDITPFLNIKLSSFSKNDTKHTLPMLALSGCILHANTLITPEKQKILAMAEGMFITYIPNKTVFIETLKLMFSVRGFNLMTNAFNPSNVYSHAELSNFAINLKSGEVNPISSLTATPHDALRMLRLISMTSFNTDYFIAFNNGQYVAPDRSTELPQNLDEAISKITPILKKCLITEDLLKIIRSTFVRFDTKQLPYLNDLCRAIQTLSQEKPIELLAQAPKPVTFAYKPPSDNNEVYEQLIELSPEDKAAVKRLC